MKNVKQKLAKAVEDIQNRDRKLLNELKEVREKALGRSARGEPQPLGDIAPIGEMAPEGPDDHEFVAETIVLRTARPVLAVRNDEAVLEFSAEDSVIWKQRLENARAQLSLAIRAVGRVEVQFHPSYEWIGTGWLVAPDVVVTNRHVAREFGRRTGEQWVFRQGVGDQRMRASIDFIEEFDRAESLEFAFERILHIEDDNGPDLAFVQVRPANGQALARPIALARAATDQDEYVAVIGYPARDSRIPEEDLMRKIFGDQYNKKRLAPGQITRTQPSTLLHDCSTLGGNSGSVVFSLGSGKAVGLHFAGRFLEANYAVPAPIVAEKLDQVTRGESPRRAAPPALTAGARQVPVSASGTFRSRATTASGRAVTCTIPIHVTVDVGLPVVGGDGSRAGGDAMAARVAAARDEADDDLVLSEAAPEDYADRQGYDQDFIGHGNIVSLPQVTKGKSDVLTFDLEGEHQQVLKYEHFSVLMSKSRRLCRYSAVNIDGNQSKKAKRPAWRTDPRIPQTAQIHKECYGNPPKFARGHMTRREDPIWGPMAQAQLGNADSMHVTNAVPQMQPFNAGVWLGLENYALENAREDDMRITVFTGPFLRDDDPVRYGIKIPTSFWKVIAFIHDDTGALCATGYRMSQEAYLQEEEFVFGQHKTTQTSIASIEQETGLSFGALADLDPFEQVDEGVAGDLTDFAQIRFYR
jgi:DNA/RNA endonuclease G (NUC1)/V8-like Glu-specific endopeptidase